MKKNKFQLKREATYQQMLEAGLMCFSEKGYAATTIADIVTRTGHTQGAFYGHFESKQELFLHVMDYKRSLTTGWTDIPKQYSPADKSLEEVLVLTLRELGHMEKGINNWILVLVDYYQQTKNDPQIQSRLQQVYQELISGIERLITVLQDQGWIPKERDVRRIAMQSLVFNEGFNTFKVMFGESDARGYIEGLVKIMS